MISPFRLVTRRRLRIPILRSRRSSKIFGKSYKRQERNGNVVIHVRTTLNDFDIALFIVSMALKLRDEQRKDSTWLVRQLFAMVFIEGREQINVTSDVGAMSSAIFEQLAVATRGVKL